MTGTHRADRADHEPRPADAECTKGETAPAGSRAPESPAPKPAAPESAAPEGTLSRETPSLDTSSLDTSSLDTPSLETPPGASASEEFQPPTNAATARAHVRHLLHTRVPVPPSPAVTNDILLVVTELVTNALRHGDGLTAFGLRLDGDALTIRVADASPAVPHTVPRELPFTPGGFGWPLIQRLSRSVTVTPAARGKTIQVVMGIDGPVDR
ncbi:ATP-binding protein [Streptomyces sp. NPDC015131]|uniref:ATP-binding protein n=1 Tax=Streptomyces sp. NPDC015131 TaxID=3364941 RepID=UPI0037006C37